MRRIVAAVVVMLAVVGLVGCGKAREVNIASFIHITVSGNDGDGYAEVAFNKDGLTQYLAHIYGYEDARELEDILNSRGHVKESKYQKALDIKRFIDSVNVMLEKNSGLSNGDVIKVYASSGIGLDERIKLKRNFKVEPFVVSNLQN